MSEILELSAQELDILPRDFAKRKLHRHPLGGGLIEDGADVHPEAAVAKGAVVFNLPDSPSRIDAGTNVYPGVRIEGCRIGENTTIRSGAQLSMSIVGDRAIIGTGTGIFDSTIGDDSQILRRNVDDPKDVCEVTSSTIWPGAKIVSSTLEDKTQIRNGATVEDSKLFKTNVEKGATIKQSELFDTGVDAAAKVENAHIQSTHVGDNAQVYGSSKDHRCVITNDRIEHGALVTESRQGEKAYVPPHLKSLRMSIGTQLGADAGTNGRGVAPDRRLVERV
jgi:carbonic anhydrase/acetyltransferase-like protein (isoleucine patch superfamily)